MTPFKLNSRKAKQIKRGKKKKQSTSGFCGRGSAGGGEVD